MMKRIFNFSDFSALYESAADVYGQNLKLVVAELLVLYFEMTKYGEYTDQEMDSDFQSIVAGNSLGDKIEAFKKIIEKAKTKSLADNKIEAAKDLIEMTNTAYNKFLEALIYIAKKYADNPTDKPEVKKEKDEDSKSLIELLNKEVEDFKANLEAQANQNESNSDFSEYNQIFEGKKSLLSDAENIISSIRGKIDSYKMDEDPRKKKFATDADLEIVKISGLIKGLREKKNKEIEKSEIEKIFNDLKNLGTNFDNGINKIIDENTTDAELEKIRNKARDLKDQISPLKNKYLKAKSEADVKGKSEKIKVSLEKDHIDYDADEIKNVNPEVKKFQELVRDAFKNVKSITDLPFYQKMGTDGKFGPNTRDMVKTLKGAFELSDKSGDITKELIDEIQIQKDTIKESVSARVYRFSSFVNVSEAAFNLAKGLEVAKTLKSYKPSGGGAGSGSGITSAAKGKAGKMEKSASKEEVKAAEETQFSEKTPEEKWKWLTETYVAGYTAPGSTSKVAKVESKGSGDNRTFDIYWEGSDPVRKTYLEKTVCYYPKSGEKLGRFKNYKYFSGFAKEVDNGYWGKKIDTMGKSSSGNFLYLYQLPEADKKRIEAQAKNVAWLNDNMGKSFKKIGKVEIFLTNMPWLEFTTTESGRLQNGGYFYKDEIYKFNGDGNYFVYKNSSDKDARKSSSDGTWRYDPDIKNAIAFTGKDKTVVTLRASDFPI